MLPVNLENAKIAVVHDFLYTFGGAERVLKAILEIYPQADVFSLFDVLSEKDREAIGIKRPVTTTFLQKMPFISRRHRLYLPLMPVAIEQLDLSEYDIIISSSYAVAKGVITGPDQLHISYVHSPMRYAWDLQHQYLKESNKDKGLKGIIARILLYNMRIWDSRTANGPNYMIANSKFISRRIKKIYGRDAKVIYPPVRIPDHIDVAASRERFFLTASRLVPYKKIHAIVEAFKELPDQKLVVAGAGPEYDRIKNLAGVNVQMLGFVSDDELKNLMQGCRAFVFAAEEDFGIIPIEAQGQGAPVIALGRGGTRETIIGKGEAATGVFFIESNKYLIADAVREFLHHETDIKAGDCHANALRFSEKVFKHTFEDYVNKCVEEFNRGSDVDVNEYDTVTARPN